MLNQQIEPLLVIFVLTSLAFIVSMVITPFFTTFLYKFKLGKKIRATGSTPVFSEMHKGKEGTPTMGGLLIWMTVLVLAFASHYLFPIIARLIGNKSIADFITHLDFLSRSQTWLPLFCLVAVGILGAIDDLLNIKLGGGLRGRHKMLWLILIGAIGAWWFYSKLGYDSIHVPGVGDFIIGFWYLPLFILVIVATANAVNLTDGLDGLAGGLLGSAFAAFAAIAYIQGNFGIAAFCGAIVGALLSFLWFNIHPARFFMGDTGSLALGATLGVIAALLNSILVLPIIGFIFVFETASVILQVFSKKVFKKKIFRSAPIHHHFQALGWPETKVTERFWVIGVVMAVIGLVIGLIGGGT